MSDRILKLLQQHKVFKPTKLGTNGIPGGPDLTQIHEMCDDFSIRINLGGFLQHPRSVPSDWRSANDSNLTKKGLKAAIAAGWKYIYISIEHSERGGLFLVPPTRWFEQVKFDQLYSKYEEVWTKEEISAEELVQKRNKYRAAVRPYRDGSLPRGKGHGVKNVVQYRQEYFDLLIKVAELGEEGRATFLQLLKLEMLEVAVLLDDMTITNEGRRLSKRRLEKTPAINTVRWQSNNILQWERQLSALSNRLGWAIADRSSRKSIENFSDLVEKAEAENMPPEEFRAELERLGLTEELVGFDKLYNGYREIWEREGISAVELVQRRRKYRVAVTPYRDGSLPKGRGVKGVTPRRQEYFDLLIKIAEPGVDGRPAFLQPLDGEIPEVAAVLENLTTTEKGGRLPQLQLEEVPAIKTVRWQRWPVSLWEKQLEPHCERLGWIIAERPQRASNLLAGRNSSQNFPDLVASARAENMPAQQFGAELQRLKLTIELEVLEAIIDSDKLGGISALSVSEEIGRSYRKVKSILGTLIKLGKDLSWNIRNAKSLNVAKGMKQGGIVQQLLANSNGGSDGLREFREALETLGPEFKSWQVALRHLETSSEKRTSINATAEEEGVTYDALHRKMGKLLDGSKDKGWGLNSHRKKRSPKKKSFSVTLKTDPLLLQTFWELGRVVFPDIVEVIKISVSYAAGATSRFLNIPKFNKPQRRMFTLKDALAAIRRPRWSHQHINEKLSLEQRTTDTLVRQLTDQTSRKGRSTETSLDEIARVNNEVRLRTKPRRFF